MELNPDGSVDPTFDVPGFSPVDVGVLSDGFLVWTDANRVNATGIPLEYLLNVRYDDLIWVGTSDVPSCATSPESVFATKAPRDG